MAAGDEGDNSDDDKDAFVTPIKRVADDPMVELETPVKGPKQVPKLLPRPVGARPEVQRPPSAEAAASAPGQVPKLPPPPLLAGVSTSSGQDD